MFKCQCGKWVAYLMEGVCHECFSKKNIQDIKDICRLLDPKGMKWAEQSAAERARNLEKRFAKINGDYLHVNGIQKKERAA